MLARIEFGCLTKQRRRRTRFCSLLAVRPKHFFALLSSLFALKIQFLDEIFLNVYIVSSPQYRWQNCNRTLSSICGFREILDQRIFLQYLYKQCRNRSKQCHCLQFAKCIAGLLHYYTCNTYLVFETPIRCC